MRLKQIQQEAESSQYKARTTRLAKWRELVVVAQRELELPPSAPEKLMLIDNAWHCFWFCQCIFLHLSIVLAMMVLDGFDICLLFSHCPAEMAFVVANPVLQFYRPISGKPKAWSHCSFPAPREPSSFRCRAGHGAFHIQGHQGPQGLQRRGKCELHHGVPSCGIGHGGPREQLRLVLQCNLSCLDCSFGVTGGSSGLRTMRLGGRLPNFSLI